MTRLLCLALALFLLIPAFACHAADDTTFDPLFPAKAENGKWGYINNKGEFIIQPQFDSAAGFRGDYAVITVFPEGFIPSLSTKIHCEERASSQSLRNDVIKHREGWGLGDGK